jgi:hypothetical protein
MTTTRCPACAEEIPVGAQRCPHCDEQLAAPSPPPPPIPQAESSPTKPCPFCAETIKASAIKCRFCGEILDQSRVQIAQQQAGAASTPSTPYNWWLLAWPVPVAGILGYILGTMIYGARFQNAVFKVLSGQSSGDPSESRTIIVTILVLLVVFEVIALVVMRRRALAGSGGGAPGAAAASAPVQAIPRAPMPISVIIALVLGIAEIGLLVGFALTLGGKPPVFPIAIAVAVLAMIALARPWSWRTAILGSLLYGLFLAVQHIIVLTELLGNPRGVMVYLLVLLLLVPLPFLVTVPLLAGKRARKYFRFGACTTCGATLTLGKAIFSSGAPCKCSATAQVGSHSSA